MKRLGLYIAGGIAFILIILAITCPDEEDYKSWLERKHRISCTNEGSGIYCKQFIGGQEIELDWTSKHVQSAAIYMRVNDHYMKPDGSVLFIRTFGILGMLYDY
ncbi:hypothetical protein AB6A23_08475 [Paenibacillus tarimensis]